MNNKRFLPLIALAPIIGLILIFLSDLEKDAGAGGGEAKFVSEVTCRSPNNETYLTDQFEGNRPDNHQLSAYYKYRSSLTGDQMRVPVSQCVIRTRRKD